MMKKATLILAILAGFFALIQQNIIAQETKEEDKRLKNTIHLNITNPIIFGGRALVLGYERVVNKYQSFSINAGLTQFPNFNILGSDSLTSKSNQDQSGFNFSVDYRFYLSRQNKYPAPRGVYIGPYYSYNSFGRQHVWTLKSTSGSTVDLQSDLNLKVHTVGIEFGYQFVFADRISLDLVLAGPGIAAYDLSASLGANLSQADREKVFEKINDALAEKFPGYGLVIDEGDFKSTGVEKTTSYGYRYMIQVGFRF